MPKPYRRRAWPAAVLLLVASIGAAPGAEAQQLGSVHFEISCSKIAQASFDHSLALLHHMTYPEARAGFERMVVLDSVARWPGGASP